MGKEIIPIKSSDGKTILHDMYVDGRWIGSRTTLDQALHFLGLDSTIRPAQDAK